MMPSVSFIIPTIRPEGFKILVDSIEALNYPKEQIEIIALPGQLEKTVPHKVDEGYKLSTGQYLAFVGDDCELDKDCLIAAILASTGLNKGLVAFHSGVVLPDEGNACEHFIIRRDIVEKIGHIFDLDFWHVGCDNLLWAKCKKMNEAYHCEEARINHKHFSKGYAMDEFYEKGWSKVSEDRALLAKKLAELNNKE